MMKPLLVLPILLSIILVPGVSSIYADVTITTVSGSDAPGCEETAEGCYIPSTATVDVWESVIFSNPDSAAYTFTSDDPNSPASIQILFDSSLVMAGGIYEWSPTEVGDVPYFCMVPPWMQGLIIAQGIGVEEEEYGDEDNTLEIENGKLKK